jgi:ADP-ribose pyrophosphatase
MSSSAPPSSAISVVGYEQTGEETFGGDGYLRVRRVHLRNVRADGSRSRPYFCELVDRPRHGTDAVVVALWHRDDRGQVQVLLRAGLRPALAFGRPADRLPIPDPRPYLHFTEVVAGILEDEDRGEEGIRQRAALEAWEEAGLRVPAERFARLGGRVFPTPGMAPECFHLVHAEVDPRTAALPEGDGSPMEEGCVLRFVPLAEALQMCDRGEIEDAKTELALRRLQARLSGPATETTAQR